MVKVEGRNPVIELMKGQRKVSKLFLQQGIKGDKIELIQKKAREKNIRIDWVDKSSLNNLSKTDSHQGVVALTEKIELYTPQDILEEAKKKNELPFVIILDQIQDPHNFGAIIRTAYAAGAHGLIFPKDRSAGVTPVVEKTSAGAVEHLMLAEVSNINYTIRDLKEAGLWIAGTDINGKSLYFNQDLKGPIGIVIGNEGQGLRRLVTENCDFLIKIPMKGKLASLNASVASGIVIYEVLRQRR